MTLSRLLLIAPLGMLAACATERHTALVEPEPEPTQGVLEVPQTAPQQNGQLDFSLASGVYNCDLGQRVNVVRPRDALTIEIGWTGRHYQLARNVSFSGLPRYENTTHGLVRIDLPWKGMLLDATTNKPLASDCTMS